jgi:short-subunit dehydrogenase
MRDLRNKVVVVTGAASGIGAALARGLSKRGAALALVDVDETRLKEIVTELSGKDKRVTAHVADVGDRKSMEQLPEEVMREHGSIDVLINNAGVSVGAMFADHSIDDAEWLLRINLMGVIYGCKFFLPYLQKGKEGHIVNLSSMFGLFSMPGQAMYSASKAGIRAFTEALWTELAGSSIRLTTVHPGTIKSNFIRSARMPDLEAKARAANMQERYGMPTDKAAEKIIRAIEKNKLRVLVGIDAYIGEFLKRLFPVGLQRMLTLLFRLGGVEANR